jgi:hypothetical protein
MIVLSLQLAELSEEQSGRSGIRIKTIKKKWKWFHFEIIKENEKLVPRYNRYFTQI